MTENPQIGSSLEAFLVEEGRLEEATEIAIKRVFSLNVADLAPAARLYRFRLVTPGEALRAMRHLGV